MPAAIPRSRPTPGQPDACSLPLPPILTELQLGTTAWQRPRRFGPSSEQVLYCRPTHSGGTTCRRVGGGGTRWEPPRGCARVAEAEERDGCGAGRRRARRPPSRRRVLGARLVGRRGGDHDGRPPPARTRCCRPSSPIRRCRPYYLLANVWALALDHASGGCGCRRCWPWRRRWARHRVLATADGRPAAGLLAAATMLVLPAVSRYGQDARPYAFSVLLVVALTLCWYGGLGQLVAPGGVRRTGGGARPAAAVRPARWCRCWR